MVVALPFDDTESLRPDVRRTAASPCARCSRSIALMSPARLLPSVLGLVLLGACSASSDGGGAAGVAGNTGRGGAGRGGTAGSGGAAGRGGGVPADAATAHDASRPGTDAGRRQDSGGGLTAFDAAPPSIELGVWTTGFVALADGASVNALVGPQGALMMVFGARVRGIDSGSTTEVTEQSPEVVVQCDGDQNDLVARGGGRRLWQRNADAIESGEIWVVFNTLRPPGPVTLSCVARVTAGDGRTASDRRRVETVLPPP